MFHTILILRDVNRYDRGKPEFHGHVHQGDKGLTELNRLPLQHLSECLMLVGTVILQRRGILFFTAHAPFLLFRPLSCGHFAGRGFLEHLLRMLAYFGIEGSSQPF